MIVATAVFPSLVAVTIALPGASAVTRPAALTVATVALLVVNVTGRAGKHDALPIERFRAQLQRSGRRADRASSASA